MIKKTAAGIGLLAGIVGTFWIMTGNVAAAPATFTVTNTNDSGAGSLRAALTSSNANNNLNDVDTINFNIPGSGVHTISLLSALPEIEEMVDINGYSQPGASANTKSAPEPMDSVIKIQIDGGGNMANVLAFSNVEFNSQNSTVRGLSIYGGTAETIRDSGFGYGGNNFINVYGNYINVDATGLSMPNKNSTTRDKSGVKITSLSKVGGASPAQRNIISSTAYFNYASVIVSFMTGTIEGNYIGIGRDGHTDLGAKEGVELGVWGTIVGGDSIAQKNVISGNDIANILIRGHSNAVRGNYIGTTYEGKVDPDISNGVGVAIAHYSSDNVIGGTEAGEGNLIAGVAGAGISTVLESLPYEAAAPSWNAFLGNSIHSISTFNFPGFGTSNLGIDLNGPGASQNQGPTANDVGDTDDGPNGLINFPVLKSAQQVGNQLTITYDLDALDSPTDEYRIEFFASDERSIFGYGPGETYLGTAGLVSPGTNKTVTLTVNGDYTRKALSATTTAFGYNPNPPSEGDGALSEYGATSEFARNIMIGSETDFDSDGVSNTIEAAAPNGGDANNDGIADSQQPTVTSYILADSDNVYATLVTDGCSENGTVSSLNLASLNKKDNGYSYPYGLTDFTLNCSRGDTVNVKLYIHATEDPEQYIPRKYNAQSQTFSDIPGSTLTKEVLGASTTIKLAYSLTDGGDLDDDRQANGTIVDPVGLAVEKNGVGTELAKTGLPIAVSVLGGLLLITGALYTYSDYQRHKRPLKQADPETARTYTYLHHLRLVSIPLFNYRLKVTFSREMKLARGQRA